MRVGYLPNERESQVSEQPASFACKCRERAAFGGWRPSRELDLRRGHDSESNTRGRAARCALRARALLRGEVHLLRLLLLARSRAGRGGHARPLAGRARGVHAGRGSRARAAHRLLRRRHALLVERGTAATTARRRRRVHELPGLGARGHARVQPGEPRAGEGARHARARCDARLHRSTEPAARDPALVRSTARGRRGLSRLRGGARRRGRPGLARPHLRCAGRDARRLGGRPAPPARARARPPLRLRADARTGHAAAARRRAGPHPSDRR